MSATENLLIGRPARDTLVSTLSYHVLHVLYERHDCVCMCGINSMWAALQSDRQSGQRGATGGKPERLAGTRTTRGVVCCVCHVKSSFHFNA